MNIAASPGHACPYCSGTGVLRASGDTGTIPAIALGLRAACTASGSRVTGDGRVDEGVAATLVGRARKTLRNWRALDCPIPFITRNGRVLYSLDDLARWMVESGHEHEI